ncbi:MAG TPA: L,D-transpeptidase [Bryobacteraceae bacterium]|nr:L,D-transpeptidase [Bryobacteraceae bacterium]
MRIAAFSLALLMMVDTGFAAPKRKARATRNRTAPAAALDTATVNDPNVGVGASQSRTPAALLRAQILLDRAAVSPGEIDAQGGLNFQRALTAFQLTRSLPASGQLDETTWQALNTDTAPALVPYMISEADVAGPFENIPADIMEQAKLKSLTYRDALESLGEQFHISPALLKRINAGRNFATGEEILVPNVLGAVTGKAARVVVKKAGTLTAYDPEGKVLAHYPCSSGSEHDPLQVGTWKIIGVAKNPPFHYNPSLFWDADPSHSKAKIPPGPNNPVGVVWIDLSKEHYGIHGTPEPSKVGHTQSHGCIRLTNWDAMELAGLVGPGTPAILED